MDIYTMADMITALQMAQPGEVLLFNLKNNIPFTGTVLLDKGVTVNLVNGSGNENVALMIAGGGSFRNFSTSGASIDNITMIVGPGIIMDGGGTGGGIQILGNSCLLTLDGCIVANCRSGGNGGGILMQGNASRSRLVMNNALIENCQAGAGGGIFGGACDVEMNGGEISGNHANNTGGAIATIAGANRLGSTITINGGRIVNNSVSAGDGGGITAHDTIVTIEGAEISSNTADNNGGGIYSLNQTGIQELSALVINNSNITGNTIRNFGGGIRVENPISEFTVTNCTVSGNRAVSVQAGSNQGGGIYCGGTSLTVRDTKISANEAGTSGGGIFAILSTLIVGGSTEISENIAALSAGGIYGFQGCTIIIEDDARVIGNHAYCGNDPENVTRGGGGIALLSFGSVSTLTVRGEALVAGNTAVSYGGGVWTYPTFGPETVVNIEGGAIAANSANYGGGISMGEITGYTPVLTISGGNITGNVALTDGGGIIAKGSTVTVAGGEIAGNSAARDGGGIFTDQLANVTVYADAAFRENYAGSYAYWQVTSGGDSDIHNAHIFTNRFSTFVPLQTPPPQTWVFTNAYNNYDINYVQMLKSVNVRFNYDSTVTLVHESVIDSFLGATVLITPRESFVGENGAVWTLQPPNQPAQTLVLADPEATYDVVFEFLPSAAANVTVSEYYIDMCGCPLVMPTQTTVEVGGNYNKTAPVVMGYTFVGYKIDNGPLQTSREVNIIGLSADTVVMFIYVRSCSSPCCGLNPCAKCCFQTCCSHQKACIHRQRL